MPEEAHQIYQAFLLRCWHLGPATAESPAGWRFELRGITAEARQLRFGDLEQLKEFIAAELAALDPGKDQGSLRTDR